MERRALLALISLIRDREPDREKWPATGIPLRLLYERLYAPQPGKPDELQRKYQRQATRRALGRLHPHYITALALGWVNVEDGTLVRWQGGGRRRQSGDGHTVDRPNWKLVGLTRAGIKLAELIERSPESGDLPGYPAVFPDQLRHRPGQGPKDPPGQKMAGVSFCRASMVLV